jgi:hypothetical protein
MSAWSIRRTKGGYRFATYACPHCRTESNFELGVNATKPPVARCCTKAEAFPADDPKFSEFLSRTGFTLGEAVQTGKPWRRWHLT